MSVSQLLYEEQEAVFGISSHNIRKTTLRKSKTVRPQFIKKWKLGDAPMSKFDAVVVLWDTLRRNYVWARPRACRTSSSMSPEVRQLSHAVNKFKGEIPNFVLKNVEKLNTTTLKDCSMALTRKVTYYGSIHRLYYGYCVYIAQSKHKGFWRIWHSYTNPRQSWGFAQLKELFQPPLCLHEAM